MAHDMLTAEELLGGMPPETATQCLTTLVTSLADTQAHRYYWCENRARFAGAPVTAPFRIGTQLLRIGGRIGWGAELASLRRANAPYSGSPACAVALAIAHLAGPVRPWGMTPRQLALPAWLHAGIVTLALETRAPQLARPLAIDMTMCAAASSASNNPMAAQLFGVRAIPRWWAVPAAWHWQVEGLAAHATFVACINRRSATDHIVSVPLELQHLIAEFITAPSAQPALL
eukprot:gene8715-22714_t